MEKLLDSLFHENYSPKLMENTDRFLAEEDDKSQSILWLVSWGLLSLTQLNENMLTYRKAFRSC